MSTPLRDLINSLEADAASQAAFADDPVAFLADHGWDGLDGLDVGTALSALADEVPIERAIRLGEIVDGGPPLDGSLSGAIQGLSAAIEVAAATPGDPQAPSDPEPVAGDPDDPETALDREDRTNGDDDGYDGDPTFGIDHPDPGDEPAEPADTGDDPAVAIDGTGESGRLGDDGDPGGREHDDLDHLDAGPGPGLGDAAAPDEPGAAQVQPVVEELPGADVDGDVGAEVEASLLDADPVDELDPVAEHEPLAQEPDGGGLAEGEPEVDDL